MQKRFNTSHVTLYQYEKSPSHTITGFQYISCYSLSQEDESYDETGIVSPLYIVNTVCDNNSSLFWYYYFDTPERTNNYLKPLVRMGAKHTMNISNEEWLSGKILAPCHAEQQKIADCLSSLDDVIEKQKATLVAWEEMKKGLLQQMFV